MNSMNLINIKIIFVADNTIEYDSIIKSFNKCINIKVYRCDISQIKPVDCMVCPGNSYGIITNKHASTINKILNVEDGVKNAINNLYYGEQPVGTCMLMSINNKDYKYMAHIPVSRVPSEETDSYSSVSLVPDDTNKKNNVYYAFRAVLTSVLNYNKVNRDKISTISCPLLYTDYKNKNPNISANQMRLAYSMIDLGQDCSIKTANEITALLK